MRTREQVMAEVWAVCRELGLGYRHALVAGVTIAQEAGDKSSDPPANVDWWCPFNRKDPQTERFEHDSESNDGHSSGYYQQQSPPGQGSWWPQEGGEFGNLDGARRRMDLREATRSFLCELTGSRVKFAGDADPRGDGELAQAVQRSRYPDRYERHAPYVREVLDRVLAGSPSSPAPTNSGGSTVPPGYLGGGGPARGELDERRVA
jgi:hypothetical protein